MSDQLDTIRRRRLAFTLKEMLIVISGICGLCALVLPAIQRARENQRSTACQNNLKQIDLALLNYEDKRRSLPPISTHNDLTPDVPGNASSTTDGTHPEPGTALSPGAGYSWLVWVIAQDCGPDFPSLSSTSAKFTRSAFSPGVSINGGATHAAMSEHDMFICPSFSGGRFLDDTPRQSGNATGTVETGTLPPNYRANGGNKIAITNYNAMLGTHIDTASESNCPAHSASLQNSNNGLMSFRGTSYKAGRSLSTCSDGTSQTILVAETRERRFSSWYDGTMNWVVAARHSNPSAGTMAITPATNTLTGKINGQPVDGGWVVGTDGTTATGGAALNYGPTKANPTAVYLPTAALADPDISGIAPGRLWGPSSEHAGGVVNHSFADGHVGAISDQIDPNVYLWMATRNGGEPFENAP